VVGVNEFYTAKKCPVCEEFVGQVDMRRIYCSKCKAYLNRHVMAGHNMANVVRGHLIAQQRPRYFQPRAVDGNYPWEESPHSVSSVSRPLKRGDSSSQGVKGASVKRKAGDWTEQDQDQVKRRIVD
jgi:hypothetical protein